MDVKEVDFHFRHQRKAFTATLQIMKPSKTTMYRVNVHHPDRKKDPVFVFYEVNGGDGRFFHYPSPSEWGEMAKSILKELKNF